MSNETDEKSTITLHTIKTGFGRTRGYEDGKNADTDLTWQAVETGDLDGYYDGDAEDEDVPENESVEDFVNRVHPHCENCGAVIFTNSGDWLSPDGEYYCRACITVTP